VSDPLQALFAAGVLPTTSFPTTSRYHGIATARFETPAGRVVVYLRRRFVPPPERFALLQEHRVQQGDRLDNIAARYLGDPEQFWRLADANGVLRPDELTETVGSRIRVTLPEGIPGGEP
jgi:nucleoid-associated protein YgaU